MHQQHVAELFEGWNEGKTEKLANLFSPDAKLFTENGNTYVGRDRIREAIIRKLGQTPGMKLSIVGSPDVQLVTTDVAVVEVVVQASGAPKGTPSQGRWVSVAKKTGEDWHIERQWMIATPS